MKINILFLGITISALLALHGCGQDASVSGKMNNAVIKDIQETPAEAIDNQDSLSQPLENLADVRHPDMKIRVRKGNTLHLETDGFQLLAVDTALMHTGVYSVTSLMDEELAPLPQGMRNMTAATAGYRLLPSGEHFAPYAELRVAYDPDRLPLGYTPEDIYTSYYDTVSMSWVRLERLYIDTVSHEIVSATTHFTDFINELLKAPEMPETQAFVPTAMSDLEAVNPLDNIPIFQVPTPNGDGSAILEYPIRIPSGRSGMQPNIVVTYNSQSGNGWLGVGWDINIPAITIDTRWGVPRYNSIYETEIYLYGGTQLITKDSTGNPRPMPHRTNRQTLRGDLRDSVRFYVRTGDAHDSIIRHSTSTTNYWWEVIDRNGVTHYYGHYPDDTLNTYPTTLADDKGNIAKWMLAESRDTYGNWVRYYYDVDTENDVNHGRQIYLSDIEYTGNKNEQGIYHVEFNCKERSLTDIPVSCNNGFKETTGQVLCNILVKSSDTVVTGYFFETENLYESNFKTRVKSIWKIDTCAENNFNDLMEFLCKGDDPSNILFAATEQKFEYYDALPASVLFSSEKNFNTFGVKDNLSAPIKTSLFRHDSVNSATMLGLSSSSSWNVGGTAGVGFGAEVCNTSNSIGGNYHKSRNSSESLLTLVDLDGDGLADKVFVKDEKLHWRKQIMSGDDSVSFSNTDVEITQIDHFLTECSENTTWGIQAAVASAKGSTSWTTSTSLTSIYFADVDGDGLSDIVDNGRVYFNRLVDSIPTFTLYKENIPEPGDEDPEQNAMCDSIIFDGQVNDSVACRWVWIEQGREYVADQATAMAMIQQYSSNEGNMALLEYGGNDSLYVLLYHRMLDCSRRNLAARNTSNTESVRVWVAPTTGTIVINSYVALLENSSEERLHSKHTDGITYTIQHSHHITRNGDTLHSQKDTILKKIVIDDIDRNDYQNYDSSINVEKGDLIFFRLQSNEDNQFDDIEDQIFISYPNESYKSDSAFILSDDKYFQAPFNGHYSLEVNYTPTNGITLTTIKPSDTTGYIAEGDIIRFILRSDSSDANWDAVDFRAKIKFWAEGSTDTMTIWTPGLKEIVHHDTCIWGEPAYQKLFGLLNKGWGQFTYLPHDIGDSCNIIHLDSLIVPKRLSCYNQSDTNGLRDWINTPIDSIDFVNLGQEEFNGLYGVSNNPLPLFSWWIEMTADAQNDRWVSFGAENSIGRLNMSNSLQKDWYSTDDTAFASLLSQPFYDDAIPIPSDSSRTKAIRKVNQSDNHSFSFGIDDYGASYSFGSSNVEMDYMDMNGDRYPDIVGTSCIQYRQQWGGLGDMRVLPFGIQNVSTSETRSVGFSFGASPASHQRMISSKPSNAKFSLASDGSADGELSVGWDDAPSAWTDINGDGLPDHVRENGTVRLNIGYDFLDGENWHFDNVRSGQSLSTSISGKVNIYQGSIQFGAGLGRSLNRPDHILADINGDGLPDLLWRNLFDIEINQWSDLLDPRDSIHVLFNLGNGRWSPQFDLNIKNFNLSESYNESLDLGATVGTTLFGVFKVTAGANGSPYSGGVSRDRMQLADINGDGLPDLVTSASEDVITVRYNRGGKTNLLKKVINSTGSEIHLHYSLSHPCYQQPSRCWLMDTVITIDTLNHNGGKETMTVIQYSNPQYDRFERSFLGYGTVITKQISPSDSSVYRIVQRDYHNSNILFKGRPKKETTMDGARNIFVEKEFQYDYAAYFGNEIDSCIGNVYSMRDRIQTKFYEGEQNPQLIVAEVFEYDKYHNVTKYIDEGDVDDINDGIEVNFLYLTGLRHNLIGLRKGYTVNATNSSDTLRQTVIYHDTIHGQLIRQVLYNNHDSSFFDFVYDTTYGNLSQATLPRNGNGQRMTYSYSYDSYIHTYPIRIVNSFGETTSTSYNYHWGKPTRVTDITNNTIFYDYDFAGRLTSVTSPLNTGGTPTLVNDYHPVNYYHGISPSGYTFQESPTGHPYSVSMHYDDQGTLITQTAVITDGFGRVLQTKKGLTENEVEKIQVSGRAFVDAFGRVVKQGDPFTVSNTYIASWGRFDTLPVTTYVTCITYDVLDRKTMVTQPFGIATGFYYDIENDADSHRRFYTRVTDPEGNITHQYADYEGRQVQVTDALGGTTKMHFDNLGQLLWSEDPEGFRTLYGYDNLGRLTFREHPDAGITIYKYDPFGNLIKEINPLGEISYIYAYNRPLHKHYSFMDGNDVTYEYGTIGNERGRLWRITDGSGIYECHYDALGNVTDETRTIALPGNGNEVYRFQTKYNYDSWGRMLNMTYPDGEQVKYSYTWGGDLVSMDGDHTYIKNITYNGFGQRDSILYGNNTSAKYIYDSLHRLCLLKSYEQGGTVMQNVVYTFDRASNITSVFNNVSPLGSFDGHYENDYSYDALHRLVGSVGDNALGNYNMEMRYSPSGRISYKYYDTPTGSLSPSKEMYYGYCDNFQPHAVRRIYNHEKRTLSDMRWDPSGNLGQVTIANDEGIAEQCRFLFWTEDNRLHTAVDDKHYSYYVYDHSGERRVKLTGENWSMDINAEEMSTSSVLCDPTLYPSSYMVATNQGYTKHYYAGADRVAARLGGGGFSAIDYNDEMQINADILFEQCKDQVSDRSLNENDLDCITECDGDYEAELMEWIEGIPSIVKTEVEIDLGRFRLRMIEEKSIHDKEDTSVYYYHSDHLGSASWITNNYGSAVQHLQYLPYGEPFVNQRTSGYNERFTFTGKERDEETGYGYFGARYMDHELMTGWLSVDPLADKYPSISPYNYCLWNPIKLVDPDGCVVRVADSQSRLNIIRSLSKAEAKYVRFDRYGNLNLKRLSQCKSNSTNFNALRTLAKSQTEYIFSTETHHRDNSNDINLSNPYGESGEAIKGVTLLPGNVSDPSPDNNVYIITSSNLNAEDQVANVAHEGYGHAYFFELKQQGHNVNPNHDYQNTVVGYEWDEGVQFHVPIFGWNDTNNALKQQIDAAVQEARKNFQLWVE